MAADDRKRDRVVEAEDAPEPRAVKWLRGLERATEANRARLSRPSLLSTALSIPAIPELSSAAASAAPTEIAAESSEDNTAESLPESFVRIEGGFPTDWSFAKRLRFLSVRPLRVQGLPAKFKSDGGEATSWLSLDAHLGFYAHPCCGSAAINNNNNQQQQTKDQQLRDWITAFRNLVSNVLQGHCDYFYCINAASVLLVHASHGGHTLVFGPTKKAFRQQLEGKGIAYKMRLRDGSLAEPCSLLKPVELTLSQDVVDDLLALRSVPGQAVALESHRPVEQTAASRSKFIAIEGSRHVEDFLGLFLADYAHAMADRQPGTPLSRLLAPRPFLNCVLRGLEYEQSVLVRPGEKKTQETQLLVIEGIAQAPLLPSVIENVVRMVCEQNPTELIEGHVIYSTSEQKNVSALLRHQPLLHFAIDSGALWREPL